MRLRSLLLAAGLLSATWTSAGELPKTGGAHPTVRVQTEAQGRSFEEARQTAFRYAIEKVVGVVVVTEQEAQGADLTHDHIGGYSAGYIDNYEVVNSYQDRGVWHVKLNVDIASSKIPQRMLARGDQTIEVNGERLHTQVESLINERDHGDDLISNVLYGYPQQAYLIKSKQTEFKLDANRQPYANIPYDISLNPQWISAFHEAVRSVSVAGQGCNRFMQVLANGLGANPYVDTGVKQSLNKNCGAETDIRIVQDGRVEGYRFADQKTSAVINKEFLTPVGLQVDLLDNSGKTIDRRCAIINNSMFVNYADTVIVTGQYTLQGVIHLDLSNREVFNKLDRIKLSVQKTCH
jgi:hypothetical protein